MAVSQHFIAWLCGSSMHPEYLLKVFKSMSQELDRMTMGATVKTIGMPDVRMLMTPVPPLGEQLSIVNYIDLEMSKIDVMLQKAAQAIELLNEHRAALISAAVTGKVDVRQCAY
jgi:type I restriction enzyme, S subunit